MAKRSQQEIIVDILEVVTAPCRPTPIMYRANLSYSQLRFYLSFLLGRELITNRDGMWVATEKGREYLSAYGQMRKILVGE
ncbi:winged helix-turn-helix domain-containing protein [Nitrososphaera sp.]|uniref:winged helix-turn-helix domain-containing protein n=1 Tax=Nitrososphaera sp. TaxID=1971748 RepID=UPI00307DE3C6